MSQGTRSYDVVVVGAGPGGALCSLLLARAERRVLLIDRETFPRQKVCGDSLNPSCEAIWQRHGLAASFAALPFWRSSRVRFVLGRRCIFDEPISDAASVGIRCVPRLVLDAWLVDEAKVAGVDFQPSTSLVSADFERQQIETTSGKLSYRFLVGADGRNSSVARLAGLAGSPSTVKRVAWQARFDWKERLIDALDPPALCGAIEMNFFPGGYAGLNISPTGSVNLSLVLEAGEKRPPQIVANELLPGLPTVSWTSVYPIERRGQNCARERVVLVGDAGRLLEPFTGEGMRFALLTAEMAAEEIIRHFDGDGSAAEVATSYRKRHARLYQEEADMNGLAQWVLRSSRRARWGFRLMALVPGLLPWMFHRVYRA